MRWFAFPVALMLAACGETAPSEDARARAPAPPESTSASAPSTPVDPVAGAALPVAQDQGRYTSLQDCAVLERMTEEAGFVRERCPGPDGYALEVTESDGRQNVALITGGGEPRSLNLPGVVGSGFSTLGPRVEWRGGGAPADPVRALILRYAVVENPVTPERPVSYLVVARLDRACVTARVPPGGKQNATARGLADKPGPCLPNPA